VIGAWTTSRVLIVEDDAIIAYDLAEQIEAAGFLIAGIATTLTRGLELCETCDAAILDVNLGRETSAAIAEKLAELDTPYIAVSGYARADLPGAFRNAPLFGKPVQVDRLAAKLQHLLGSGN
jgi:CheY-like chemotaxis protein